jgi:DNA recombination protein RmuC
MLRGRGDSTSLKFELDRLEEKIRNEFTSNRKEMSEAAAATRMELTASVHALGSGQQQQLKNFSERLDSLQNILTQSAQGQREELTRSQQAFTEILTTLVGRLGEAQDKQLAGFAAKLAEMTRMIDDNSKSLRKEQGDSLKSFNDANVTAVNTMTVQQKELLETLRNTIEQKFESIRLAVSEQLDKVRQENSLKLEEMRKTVDEKLHDTLEKRLGESFKQVSDRLEQVHKGLGEMQQLAAGVGDLKKVLTNVKVRGTWGEVQLGSLLEQILTQEQYVTNYCPKTKSQERVEFAIRLPGEGDEPVYLPIDAKFPREDYERLIEASEKGDVAGVETATKQLEARISQEARDIRDKYISPPNTTDFAILYLPTEGLYAEALRRPGLSERLQRDCRVVIAGPTTLTALLNSLQMGFRTLAIQKRSSEVWKILAAVKKKFASFGEVFDKVQKKIQEADKVLEDARSKTKTIDKALNTVETMSDDDANRVLAIPVIPELALNNEEDQEQQA